MKIRLTAKKINETVVISKVGSHDKEFPKTVKRKMLSLSFLRYFLRKLLTSSHECIHYSTNRRILRHRISSTYLFCRIVSCFEVVIKTKNGYAL